MKIRVGYELVYDCPQPTPMILMLNVHYTRISDIVVPDHLIDQPSVPDHAPIATASATGAPASSRRRGASDSLPDGMVSDTGLPDLIVPSRRAARGGGSARGRLVFLLGSRYCETDRLSEIAWKLFGQTPLGWARVQAICDFVHHHIAFGYEHARADQDGLGGLQRAHAASAATSRIWPSPSAAA